MFPNTRVWINRSINLRCRRELRAHRLNPSNPTDEIAVKSEGFLAQLTLNTHTRRTAQHRYRNTRPILHHTRIRQPLQAHTSRRSNMALSSSSSRPKPTPKQHMHQCTANHSNTCPAKRSLKMMPTTAMAECLCHRRTSACILKQPGESRSQDRSQGTLRAATRTVSLGNTRAMDLTEIAHSMRCTLRSRALQNRKPSQLLDPAKSPAHPDFAPRQMRASMFARLMSISKHHGKRQHPLYTTRHLRSHKFFSSF